MNWFLELPGIVMYVRRTGPKHPVECHEIWDYDDKQYHQKLVGMIALCPDCHQVKHIGRAQIQGLYQQSLNHLYQVNNMTKKEGELYIKECFKQWEARSQQQWTLDISLLKS